MPTHRLPVARGTRSQLTSTVGTLRRATSRPVLLLLALALCLALPSNALAGYVYLDPGHGGRYPGAVYGGVTEANVNLMLALEVRDQLLARGHRVGMTRTSNTTVGSGARPAWHWDDDGVHYRYCDSECRHDAPITDLQARVDKANAAGADIFISIHNNAGSSAARGTETYHNWDNETDLELSRSLARLIQQEVTEEAGTRDRGTYPVGFYVVRWSNMPAVLLEVGFLSNASDRALLLSPAFRRQVAKGIADAVDRFFASDPFQPLYPRVAGPDRYATAAAIALDTWPEGADTVLLASGTAWPDSLAATPFAVRRDAPLLLVPPDGTIPAATAEAIRQLAPSRIIVLGGPRAVASRVATEAAASAGIPVEAVSRIAGTDRTETAADIARRVGVPADGSVFIVSAEAFPDALSVAGHAGEVGAPILMSASTTLSASTAGFLEDNSASIRRVYVIGGPRVVDDDVAREAARIAGASLTRVYGADRFRTNLAVIRSFYSTGDLAPFVARGTDFPDALVAGVSAAKQGEPVLLVDARYLPAYTREMLLNDYERFTGFMIVGGPRAVSIQMEWMIQKALAADRDW